MKIQQKARKNGKKVKKVDKRAVETNALKICRLSIRIGRALNDVLVKLHAEYGGAKVIREPWTL